MTDLMPAARWYAPRDVRTEQVPVPVPLPGQVLVAVERTGLCGSDLEEYREGPVAIPPSAVPITLGHEVVGTVVECPGGEIALGTRVVPDVVVGCGRCWWCARHEEGLCPDLLVRGQQQDGGLARFMAADAATCVRVPDDLDVEVAAFAEPAAVAVRALRKAGDLSGAVVCVQGAGTVGQLIVQAALAAPATRVVAVDPVPGRRKLAQGFGAVACAPDEAVDVVRSLSGGRGADVVLECAGVPSAPAASVAVSRRGATVVLVGFRHATLALPWLDVVLGERRLVGTAAHVWDTDVAPAVALLARGVLDPRPLHTATVPLGRAPEAFERLDTDPSALKLLVAP
ncbi:zinc-dependent alcohol dehydrogenase [Streptomyces sp. CA-111067]|uniref:zinc-dependent alcohol dehydrogenase n=1 Tax=Streptomyces sp. CA-111067 TaxID=3240046 RepID=UPI003D998F1D